MAITQRFMNFDKYFISTEGDKVVLNDLRATTKKDLDDLNNNIMTVYDNIDAISTKPSCDCGMLVGQYQVGKICPTCGTKCVEPYAKVKPLFWLRTMDHHDPDVKFINPAFWMMLSEVFSNNSNVDYIRYLCDSKYNPPVDPPKHIIAIRDNVLNGIRTYKNTMANIENILVYYLNIANSADTVKAEKVRLILDVYRVHKEDLFSNYLPIINKKLFVVERTTKGQFINLISSSIINVVYTWIEGCNKDKLSEKRYSSIMATVLSNLSSLYYKYFKELVFGKSGIFRKHVYGARSHFTFRCVIVSHPGPHEHDTIVAPWVVGLTAFRPHLLNKLMKRGYNFKKASALLFKSVKMYNEEISQILDELINEAPNRKIYVLSHRNPSLKQGSSQRVYISRFNKDPLDYSIKYSSLIAKASNADYDGDEQFVA